MTTPSDGLNVDAWKTSAPRRASGGCLCGAVRFEIVGPMRDPHACHCRTCRRLSGHYVAATRAFWRSFRLVEERGLKWVSSSESVRRGFCGDCGAPLFWDDGGGEAVSIHMGALDDPSGFRIYRHIYLDEKPDYYVVGDDCPLFEGYDRPTTRQVMDS